MMINGVQANISFVFGSPFQYHWLCLSGMGFEETVLKLQVKEEKACEMKTICMHAFTDLTYVSPVVFLYLLKECYVHGKVLLPFIANLVVHLEKLSLLCLEYCKRSVNFLVVFPDFSCYSIWMF